jgi:hypothetical protein
MKLNHLENGSITEEDGKFVARCLKGKYVTYGNDVIHCQMQVVEEMKKKYGKTPQVDFKRTLTGLNYAVYKKGKR